MKKIIFILTEYSKKIIEFYEHNSIVKITVLTIGFIFFSLEFYNAFHQASDNAKDNKNSDKTTNYKSKSLNPIFTHRSNNDSLNIMIAKFENYNTNINNCIGNALAIRINQIIYSKRLPIAVKYIDSLLSPQTINDAKKILNNNNGDIIIFGLFKNSNNECGEGKVCFRTTGYNLLNNFADSSKVRLENYNLNYKEINTGQIENGQFSLDTTSFDYWIESMVILKNNRNMLTVFRNLYKIPNSLSLREKFRRYNQRGLMNSSLGYYSKAIADFDTATKFCELWIKYASEKDKKSIKYVYQMFVHLELMAKWHRILFNVFHNRIISLAKLGRTDEALYIINKRIAHIDSTRNSSGKTSAKDYTETMNKNNKISKQYEKELYSATSTAHRKNEKSFPNEFTGKTRLEDLGFTDFKEEKFETYENENDLYYLLCFVYRIKKDYISMAKYISMARGKDVSCKEYYSLAFLSAVMVDMDLDKIKKLLESAHKENCNFPELKVVEKALKEAYEIKRISWFLDSHDSFIFILFVFWFISISTTWRLHMVTLIRYFFLKDFYNAVYKKFIM